MSLISLGLFVRKLSGIYKMSRLIISNSSTHAGVVWCGLLVGPCSLEYSKIKIPDHCWTDPTASELVQRHRIHSSARQHGHLLRGGSPQRPALRVSSTTALLILLNYYAPAVCLQCLSVCRVPRHNSGREKPRKPKFGRMEAHHTGKSEPI